MTHGMWHKQAMVNDMWSYVMIMLDRYQELGKVVRQDSYSKAFVLPYHCVRKEMKAP